MGYTHYWRRPLELEKEKFAAAIADCRKVLAYLSECMLNLAGWDGTGSPVITDDEISFNGRVNCGHEHGDLGIAWPAHNAGGFADSPEKNGEWFAGATLVTRCCGGDCSHETFRIERVYRPCEWEEPKKGMYFSFCKTAFKPYDLAVIACLIVFKHHFGNEFTVTTDGEDQHWFDGKMVCAMVLNYGIGYKINVEHAELLAG
jgi:hypothetical protein